MISWSKSVVRIFGVVSWSRSRWRNGLACLTMLGPGFKSHLWPVEFSSCNNNKVFSTHQSNSNTSFCAMCFINLAIRDACKTTSKKETVRMNGMRFQKYIILVEITIFLVSMVTVSSLSALNRIYCLSWFYPWLIVWHFNICCLAADVNINIVFNKVCKLMIYRYAVFSWIESESLRKSNEYNVNQPVVLV